MTTTSKYSPIIGLGVMYVWLVALLFWLPWWQSHDAVRQVVAFAGAALVSLSCASILIYANRLEHIVKQLSSQQDELRSIGRDYQVRNAATVAELERLRRQSDPLDSRRTGSQNN